MPSSPRGFFRGCGPEKDERRARKRPSGFLVVRRLACLPTPIYRYTSCIIFSLGASIEQWDDKMVQRMSGRGRKVGSTASHSVANASNPSQGQDQSVNPIQSAEGLAPCTSDDTFANSTRHSPL